MIPGLTHIFVQNYMEQRLKYILEIQELTDIILCALLMHMRNSSHRMLMTVETVVVNKYNRIWQQKNYIH